MIFGFFEFMFLLWDAIFYPYSMRKGYTWISLEPDWSLINYSGLCQMKKKIETKLIVEILALL